MDMTSKQDYIEKIISAPIRENPMRVMLLLTLDSAGPLSLVEITAFDERWHHTSVTKATKKLTEIGFVKEDIYHGRKIYSPMFVCDFTEEERYIIYKVIRHPMLSANMIRIILALMLRDATVGEIVSQYNLTRSNMDATTKKLLKLGGIINIKEDYGVRVLSLDSEFKTT